MDRDCWFMQIEAFMRVSLLMDRDMVKENILIVKTRVIIWVNGKTTKWKDLVIFSLTTMFTREVLN